MSEMVQIHTKPSEFAMESDSFIHKSYACELLELFLYFKVTRIFVGQWLFP